MRIGNIEITRNNAKGSVWITVTRHYNSGVSESFTLKSEGDILDLEYAVKVMKRDHGLDKK